MSHNPYEAYLESRVLTADPVELIRMLYRAALESVEEARRQLASGDIAGRSRAISKASAIVLELSSSLNHEAGGAVSRNLAALYEYMQHRLTEANFQQAEAPLVEVAGLIQTLLEAWQMVGNSVTSPPEQLPAEGPAERSPWLGNVPPEYAYEQPALSLSA